MYPKYCVFILFAACVATTNFALAEVPAGSAAEPAKAAQPPAPKMTISNEKPDPYLLIQERDLLQPSFRNGEPFIPFPSRARHESIYDGKAAVGVMLDAEGKPVDFLITKYTKQFFADALLDAVRREEFEPRRVKGDCVPGRFNVVWDFSLSEESSIHPGQPSAVARNPMEQLGATSDRVSDSKGKMVYKPHDESELDTQMLKASVVEAPLIPAESEGQLPLKVIVTFYVDETGKVRLPNVETCSSPELITNVIKAVSDWKFQPPTIKKKPVLVFTTRTLTIDRPKAVAPVAAPAAAPAK